MRTQKLKFITVILVLAALAALLAGCSGKKAQTDKKEDSKTITVTDAKGKVEIPADPKRIVDISGNSDILSILGLFCSRNPPTQMRMTIQSFRLI